MARGSPTLSPPGIKRCDVGNLGFCPRTLGRAGKPKRRAHPASKGNSPLLEMREEHGDVGGDDGDKGFTHGP